MISLGVKTGNKVELKVRYAMSEYEEDTFIQTFEGDKNNYSLSVNEFWYQIRCTVPNTIYSIDVDIETNMIVLNNSTVITGDLAEVFNVLSRILNWATYRSIDDFREFHELALDEQIAVISKLNVETSRSEKIAYILLESVYIVNKKTSVLLPAGEYEYEVIFLDMNSYIRIKGGKAK